MLNAGQLNADALKNTHIQQKLGWQTVNLPMETRNAFDNHYLARASKMPENIQAMKELLDLCPGRINDMTDCPKGKGPAILCASGSSIDPIMPMIKDWKGALFCSTSHASTLIKHGRTPDYIVCLDPRTAPQDELMVPDFGDAKLLGHVSIPYLYLTRWLRRARGNVYVGRIVEPTYDWYSHHLGHGYPWIRHVILPMIDSMASQLGFASWLGYSPLYLAGCDYSGPRFQMWTWDGNEWAADRISSGYDAEKASPSAFTAMNYSSRGTLLAAFMQMMNSRYNQRIYQMSKVSILNHFPYRDPEEVIKSGGVDKPATYPLDEVITNVEATLSAWETFLVPIKDGWSTGYHTYLTAEENYEEALKVWSVSEPPPGMEETITFLSETAPNLVQPFFQRCGLTVAEVKFAMSMMSYNREVRVNKEEFKRIEEMHGKPMGEMIRTGQVSIETGDMLTHSAEEYGEWDWKRLEPIPVREVLLHRRALLAEAKRRGYTKPVTSNVVDAIAVGAITPETPEVKEAPHVVGDGPKLFNE